MQSEDKQSKAKPRKPTADKEDEQTIFLRQAKAALGVTWDELAKLADIHPRALKTYRMPPSSEDRREMSIHVRRSVEQALATAGKKTSGRQKRT